MNDGRTTRPPYAYPSVTPSPVIRFELNETLVIGGEADAEELIWLNGEWTKTSRTIIVADPFEMFFGLTGERGYATLMHDVGTEGDGLYEVLRLGWPIRKGKTDEDIAQGASGTVSIWDSGGDSTVNVEAENLFGDVLQDKYIHLAIVDGRWELNAAEC